LKLNKKLRLTYITGVNKCYIIGFTSNKQCRSFSTHQTGPICYLRFFRQRVVVISDARIAQRLCVNQADKFTERPSGLFLARVLKNKGKSLNKINSIVESQIYVR
jgi:hypothetical protein